MALADPEEAGCCHCPPTNWELLEKLPCLPVSLAFGTSLAHSRLLIKGAELLDPPTDSGEPQRSVPDPISPTEDNVCLVGWWKKAK